MRSNWLNPNAAWFPIMPHDSTADHRALLIQLARLGDLVQSLPAIEALQAGHQKTSFDVLCAAPLAAVLSGPRNIGRVIPWDGAQWRSWAEQWADNPRDILRAAQTYLASLGERAYDQVYPLNQHSRSHLLTHLFATDRTRTEQEGHSAVYMRPWAEYLRQIAQDRGDNRVHLADAWCGMSGVKPQGQAPRCSPPAVALPGDLAPIGERPGLWIGLVTGAGEADRCIAPSTWGQWIRTLLSYADEAQVVLIGSGHERETGQAILQSLPTLLQGRVWDATGRTSVAQLMKLLHRCRWVIGADTGPLHLGTLMGCQALGFYFSRARVHETGPYGEGHWVYQHATQAQPESWPIQESVALMCEGRRQAAPGWTLWRNRMDHWGTMFEDALGQKADGDSRAAVWRRLTPSLCESVAA